MINLDSKNIFIVKSILNKYVPHAKILVFGSRITKKIKPHSDLDLAIDNGKPLDMMTYTNIKNDFEESDLPIRVDIVDMFSISEKFKEIILSQYEIL